MSAGYFDPTSEACDDGNTDNSDDCTDTCEVAACGDGYLQFLIEECDDGNTSDGDGCSTACTFEFSGCGDGLVADGEEFALAAEEALYLAKGNKSVTFYSNDPAKPAKFYLNSAPAHHAFTNKKIGREDAKVLHLGSQATSNERDINQLMINTVVETCQLQMGLTRLNPGSVWNTMPAHQHDRRNEVYFYFDLDDGQAVCHFMGEPQETRHIFVQNEQAVLSPPWSIHCGVGTSNYAFIWGMAGENLDYGDMDSFPPNELR